MAGSAIEEDIYQVYKDRGLVVVGVEVWNSAALSVETYQTQTEATHTLALRGYQTMLNGYDAGKNEYFIVDQNGVIQFIDSLGSTVYYWQVDTLMNQIASKVEELLPPPAVEAGALRAGQALDASATLDGRVLLKLTENRRFSITVYDIRGRRLESIPEKVWQAGRYYVFLGNPAMGPGLKFAVFKGPGLFRVIKTIEY